MKTRKLRIKRKVVVKSRKKGKLNRKISYRRKQRKSMMRRQKRNSRNNFKKRFSRKMRGGVRTTKGKSDKPSKSFLGSMMQRSSSNSDFVLPEVYDENVTLLDDDGYDYESVLIDYQGIQYYIIKRNLEEKVETINPDVKELFIKLQSYLKKKKETQNLVNELPYSEFKYIQLIDDEKFEITKKGVDDVLKREAIYVQPMALLTGDVKEIGEKYESELHL